MTMAMCEPGKQSGVAIFSRINKWCFSSDFLLSSDIFLNKYRICKKFQSGKVSDFIDNNSITKIFPETIYVQDVSFVAKGFTMKLFLQIFLNSVIYKTFSIQNFLRSYMV